MWNRTVQLATHMHWGLSLLCWSAEKFECHLVMDNTCIPGVYSLQENAVTPNSMNSNHAQDEVASQVDHDGSCWLESVELYMQSGIQHKITRHVHKGNT